MSQPVRTASRPGSASLRGRAMPPGEEVASFATYEQAHQAVDFLSDEGFPVEYLAIVGTDLRQVENITGRMTWGKVVFSGALSGLWLGIFFGALLVLVGPGNTNTTTLLISAVITGVLWGIIFQAIGYAMSRGKRDFTSISAVVASRYSIIAALHATDAARALAPLPGNLLRGGQAARRAQERRARQEAGPTAFGSRPDEQPRFGVRVSSSAAAQAKTAANRAAAAGATAPTQAAAPAVPPAETSTAAAPASQAEESASAAQNQPPHDE